MAKVRALLKAQGYVEGKLVEKSRWVAFPLKPEEFMEEVMRCVEDTDEVKLPAYAKRMVRVVEYDVPSFLEEKFEVDEDEPWGFNLDKVNDIAEEIDEFTDEEIEIIEALLEEDYELEKAMRIVSEGDYSDYRNYTEEEIVREFVNKECGHIPDFILDNVNYDDAFSDLKDYVDGTYVEAGGGYIYIEE